MLRMYSASNPLRTVIEHRLGEFEVGQLNQVFPNGEHRSIMEEIDQRVTELEKDKAQRKATAITWCEKLLDWLRPISVCLTAKDGYLSGCAGHSSQSLDPESHRSSYNDRDNSKVYSRASQQPMMMQRAPNRENSHRAVPAEGSNIVSAYCHVIACLSLLLIFQPKPSAATSTASNPHDSTNTSPIGYGIVQSNTHNPPTRLQPCHSRSTLEHRPSSIMRKISRGDPTHWRQSTETTGTQGSDVLFNTRRHQF
jgi:hypothetical protein